MPGARPAARAAHANALLLARRDGQASAMPDDAPSPGLTPLDIASQAELLELTQDAILVRAYPDSVVTYWNRGAERLYGYSRAEAHGQKTHLLLQTRFPSSQADVERALARDG